MRNVSRLLGLAALFLVTTGQASADGCSETPDPAPGTGTAAPAPVTASAPATALLPSGEYICYIALYEYTYAGRLHILDGGRYRYVTSGEAPTGTYRYGPQQQTIEFQGGALDPTLWKGEFSRREDNGAPLITLRYDMGGPRESKQHCNFNS